jgi:hypothetical protein
MKYYAGSSIAITCSNQAPGISEEGRKNGMAGMATHAQTNKEAGQVRKRARSITIIF